MEGLTMKNFTTAQRLEQVMKSRNMRQVDILNAAEPYCKKYGIKLGKNDMSQYVSGKVEPGQDKLTPITALSDGRTKEYVQLFELLNDDQKDMIIHAIKGILSGR